MLHQFPPYSPGICSHLDLLRPSLKRFVDFVCRSFSSNLGRQEKCRFKNGPNLFKEVWGGDFLQNEFLSRWDDICWYMNNIE